MRTKLTFAAISGVAFRALLVLALIACSLPSGISPTKGSLSVVVRNNINAKTLLPPIDMTAASFTVTGSGPNSATFTATSTGGTVTESGLTFGTWTIVVSATNAEGQLIGTGTASAQVNSGSTTNVSVTVTPISGTGTLSLSVNWPATQVQTPSISATLTPALGTAQTMAFTISKASASYTNASVGNGYYTLAFSLLDNGTVVAGAVDVVEIVTGQTTSGTYTFSNVDPVGGTIQVNINANLHNPLAVTISGGQATQSAGNTQTLSASVSNYSGNVVYVWYVNGASAATGSSFTFGSGVAAGYYRIDVTAFTADGTQAGSATQNVQVTGTAATVYAGGDSLNSSGVEVAGYWVNGTWTALASPYGASYNAEVDSLAISGSNVYAGGDSLNSSGVEVAGYWQNGTWVSLTNPYGAYRAQVVTLVVSGSNVYAGGYSANSSGVWIAGYWQNATWVGLANPYEGYPAQVTSLVVSGPNVYAGGYCNGSSSVPIVVAGYWLNGTWVALANAYGGPIAQVNSLVVSGSNVYAGGVASNVAGYWLNGTWVALVDPYGAYGASVTSLAVSGSNVYAGGDIGNGSKFFSAGCWVNGTSNVLPSLSSYGSSVTSIAVSGSNVYVGGYSANSSGVSVAGYWLNGTWVALANPYGSSSGVNSLIVQ